MDIAVLDYNTGSVCVYRDVDEKCIEEKYNGSVEEWAWREKGHKPSESYFMSSDRIDLYIV